MGTLWPEGCDLDISRDIVLTLLKFLVAQSIVDTVGRGVPRSQNNKKTVLPRRGLEH